MINRIWIVIILATGVSAIMGYMYTTFAYYPKIAHSRDVNQTIVGVILSLDSIPFMIVSLASPFLMRKLGRKLWLLISISLWGIAIFGFACLHFVHGKITFIVISLASRLTIGGTMSLYMTTSYSLVTILYKENTQKGIGRIQSSIGIGPIVWLILSSFIYKLFGYFVTFTVLSCTLALTFVLILVWIKNLEEEDESKSQNTFSHLDKSSYIFWDFRIIAGILNSALAMMLIDAPSSLVADRFSEFDMPEYLKGLTLLFSTIPFTIVSLLLHRLTKTSYKLKRLVICVGWILLWVGFLLIGPSSVFQFPNKVWLILLGFCFFGVSYSSMIVSNIPLLQDYANQYDTVSDEYNKVANYISGCHNLAFGFGAFVAPLIAPSIKQSIEYKGFTDLFALLCWVWMFIFIGLSCIPQSKKLKSHMIKENNSNDAKSTNDDINGSPLLT